MKLTDLQLERYGIYEQMSWQPPERGLCVVTGENESGKTTLLRFIRDMLFGYRRGKRNGRFGNLELTRDNGRSYRIYRHEGETTLRNDRGELITGEPAQLWWYGLDRKTYEQVFAVGLEDLQGAELLARDDVRSRFMGMQGGEELADAKLAVEGDMAQLLVASPQGKRRINQLLQERQAAVQDVERLSVQETEFAAVRDEQAAIDERIGAIEEKIKALDVRDRTLDKQLGAWKYYEQGMETKRRLDLCRTIHSFPADGKERWNDLVRRMAELNTQREELAAKMEPLTPQARADVIPWEPQQEAIRALYSDGARWEDLLAEETEKTEALQAWETEGATWNAAYADWSTAQVQTPLQVDWAQGRELADALRRRDNELHYWQNDEPQVETVSEDESIPVPKIQTDEEFAAWETAEQALMRTVRELAATEAEAAEVAALPIVRYSSFFWIGFALILAAAGVLYAFFAGLVGMEGLYGAGALTLLSVGSLYINHRRSHRNEIRLEKLNRTAEALRLDREKYALATGVDVPETEEEVAAVAGEIAAMRRDFYRYQAAVQARSWQSESRRRQLEEHALWEARGEKLAADRRQSESEWQQWLQDSHLPPTEADALDARKDQWQALFTHAGERQVLTVQLERIRAKRAEFEARLQRVLDALGLDLPLEPATVLSLADTYRDQQMAWQSVSERNRQYESLAAEKAVLDERWSMCETEMQALLALVDAKDAEEFADKVTAYEQCDRLQQDYETIRRSLRLYAGSEEEFNRLWAQLESGEYQVWLERRDRYADSLREYNRELTRLRQRQGELTGELKRLLDDERMAEALQRRSSIESELDDALDRYMRLAFTARVLETARRRYEADGRPEVVRRAGDYLQQMTAGRYTLMIDDSGRLQTVDSAHEWRSADIWSSGTGDQVYLALRLALAVNFAERTEEMPLILDDIFVRFDEARQRDTLAFLLDFARTRQVLLFTCHARTAELAKEADTHGRGHYYRLTAGALTAD